MPVFTKFLLRSVQQQKGGFHLGTLYVGTGGGFHFLPLSFTDVCNVFSLFVIGL